MPPAHKEPGTSPSLPPVPAHGSLARGCSGRGEGDSYLIARSQSLVHGLDDGAARVQVGVWAFAAMAQLVIVDLQESHDELVEVRDNQAQLLVQSADVGPTYGRPWLVLHKVLQSQRERVP